MSARAADVRAKARRSGRPELQVVRRRRSRSLIKRTEGRRISIYIAGAIIAAAIVAAVMMEQVVLAQSAFHLSDLRRDLQAEQERHEELLLQAAQLDSSARIERYARENLGMVEPAPGGIQYIVADIKQPKRLRHGTGRTARPSLPTEGIASGDAYAPDGGTP